MLQLQIDQEFNVPVSKLFKAWSNPEVVKKWFAPGDMSVPEASLELKEGGQYRFVMQEPEGEQHIIGGTYLEIVENEKLSFSWQWEGAPHATRVDVHFSDIDGMRSRLTLLHSEFEDQETCDKHEMGWNGCLANLQKRI